uniref:Uncharacterized protein n=1 Tax=Romanomermis culicivorax TaxID=13658 RepID=A0A915JXJ4_ROMCU
MKLVVDSVINEGPIAIVDGHATLTKGGKEVEKGKFLHVMKIDGSKYKVLRGMHNSDRPAECGK